jgi:hypothetical protein
MFFEVGTERKVQNKGAENDTGTWRLGQNTTDIGMVADIQRQSNDIKAVPFKYRWSKYGKSQIDCGIRQWI